MRSLAIPATANMHSKDNATELEASWRKPFTKGLHAVESVGAWGRGQKEGLGKVAHVSRSQKLISLCL